MQFQLLVTKQPKNPREGYGKIRWKYIPRCILYLSTHVHPLPFHVAATIYRSNRVDVSDPEFAFPRKIHGGRGDRRMVDALRGWKRAKGGTFLRFILSFSPLDYWNERLAGDEGLGGNSEHSFLTDLTGQNDSLGRTSIDEQLISYDLSRFRDFDGRIVDLGTIHYVFWVIFCAWQIRRNQIRVDRSG